MSPLDQLQAKLEAVDRELQQEFEDHPPEFAGAARQKLRAAQPDLSQLALQLRAGTLTHPEPIFHFLRRIIPILVVDKFALVTRFDDVQDVLSHDAVFQVPYGQKFAQLLEGRNFFLGMSNSAEYQRDVANLRKVMRPEDLAHIGRFVDQTVDPVMAKIAEAPGRLDVVKFAATLPMLVLEDYFGMPAPSPAVAEQCGVMLAYLFLQASDLEGKAITAAKELRQSLEASLDARKLGRGKRDDVLERCLQLQDARVDGMDDVRIIDNLFGLVVGAIPTTAALIARAIDELLRRPELEEAKKAATRNDLDRVRQYVFEAIRFNALTAGVFRTAAEDYTVARGTWRATTIPAGATVLAALQSAMLDGDRIERPDQFRLDRRPQDYMHFGYGLHTCFGQHINEVMIPRIASALLRRPGLQRAAGMDGTLQLEGSFPKRLIVEFDHAAVAAH